MKIAHKILPAAAIAAAGLSLAGCATIRQVDSTVADAKLASLQGASTLAQSSQAVRDLAGVYEGSRRALEKDIIGGGDKLTNLGIAGGIAAVADAGIGVFKALGIGAGILGTYDVRYKPGQQRQFYLDAMLALNCIAARADKLEGEIAVFSRLVDQPRVNADTIRSLISTTEQMQAETALGEATRNTYLQVQQVHRRLDEKLFSVVATQGFSSVRDALVKSSIDAQKSADSVKAQSLSAAVLPRVSAMAKKAAPTDEQARQSQIEKQLPLLLADAATYKTDIAVCSADFMK